MDVGEVKKKSLLSAVVLCVEGADLQSGRWRRKSESSFLTLPVFREKEKARQIRV